MKEFANNNYKFDISGRKFSKQVENNVGKGEIALTSNFFLFQCFQSTCTTDMFGKGSHKEPHQIEMKKKCCKMSFVYFLPVFLCGMNLQVLI